MRHPLPALVLCLLPIAMPEPAVAQQGEDIPPPLPAEEDEPVDEQIRIIGAGAGGASGSTVTFNWSGPGRLDYGVYDHGCKNVTEEFNYLLRANQSLVGSVAPQAVSWDQALATLRTWLENPAARAVFDAAIDPGDSDRSPLELADPDATLLQLFAAVEQAPDDPLRLFNFAGALNRNGMPNEALAAIVHIKALGKPPALPLEVNAQAALDYQEGYAEMLRGRLATAKTKLQSAISQDAFINSASHSLALIQAQEGNSGLARTTYMAGMWRFTPKYLIACGGSSDDVRPPVDDMFDTSMGVEVDLVEIWHPDIATDLEPFLEMAGALATARLQIAEPLKQRMIAMGDNARFAGGTDDPYDTWAEYQSQLIASLDEDEPYVLQHQDALDGARRAAARIASHNQAFVLQRIVELSMQPGNHCPTIRGLITNGIQGVLPHAERVEAAYRAYARAWYKMATGLTSNIGDPEWFEYNDVALRAEIESMNAGMVVELVNYYSFPADAVKECPEEFVEMFPTLVPPAAPADPCTLLLGNNSLNHTFRAPKGVPGPSFDVSIGCKEIKVDGKFDIVKAGVLGNSLGVGARSSMSFRKGQGFDMFAGVGADAKLIGRSGGAGAGVYISGDANGLTDAGGRVKLNRIDGTKDNMNFAMMAKPRAAPRGPSIQIFRNN